MTRCQKNGSDRRMENTGITPGNLGNINCRGHGPNMGCHATAATALLLLLLLLLVVVVAAAAAVAVAVAADVVVVTVAS